MKVTRSILVAWIVLGFLVGSAPSAAAQFQQPVKVVADFGEPSGDANEDGAMDIGEELWRFPLAVEVTVPPMSACTGGLHIDFKVRDVGPGMSAAIEPPHTIVNDERLPTMAFTSSTHPLGELAEVVVWADPENASEGAEAVEVQATVTPTQSLSGGCTWSPGNALTLQAVRLTLPEPEDDDIQPASIDGEARVPGPGAGVIGVVLLASAWAARRPPARP